MVATKGHKSRNGNSQDIVPSIARYQYIIIIVWYLQQDRRFINTLNTGFLTIFQSQIPNDWVVVFSQFPRTFKNFYSSPISTAAQFMTVGIYVDC